MAEVILEHVTKMYPSGTRPAVSDANLTINDKEFVVLVGPSGCGKSTLLRMIAGLEEISSGKIYIDGQVVNNVSPKDRDIAMVFQNYALYPHMNVYENMAFGLKLRKFPQEEIRKRVEEAAQILGIADYLERKPKELSGGQRQRVAVGRAIVRKPKVFLFDEPLSNLDAKMRVQMRIEINRLHQRLQSTMIYVTHDQVEAMTMGDKIVVMKDGVIQQVDSPLNIYNNPANQFVAGFIGSPAMNFFQGTIIPKEEKLFFRNGSLEIEIPEHLKENLLAHNQQEVVLGIRPEHIIDSRQTQPEGPVTMENTIRVDVIEPVGNETFVYFNHDNKSQCMRINADLTYKPGEEIQIRFMQQKLYFFDAVSGVRID
ncbi:MAG: sn-glycerol-3-phosphate ABC transporter ATP-binding protein UgpC [Calditrichia bacterium]